MTQVSDAALDATFTFARKLRDRKFHRFLESHGYREGQNLVIALPDELIDAVFGRVLNQAAPPVAIIAIFRPDDLWGFAFMTVSSGHAADAETVTVGEGATIGMLYDAMSGQSESFKVPAAWGVQVRRLVAA